MSPQILSEKALHAMRNAFSATQKESFDFDYFRNLFPEESDESINQGLYLLEKSGLVTIQPADGIAYVTLLIN